MLSSCIPVDPPVKQKTLRQSDVDDIVSDQILFGDDAGHQDIKDLYDELREEYADETKRKISISSAGGIFKDHPIELDKPQDDLRKLVGVLCNENAWGGKLEVKEKTLRDAISSAHSMISLKSLIAALSLRSPFRSFLTLLSRQEKSFVSISIFSCIIHMFCLMQILKRERHYPAMLKHGQSSTSCLTNIRMK